MNPQIGRIYTDDDDRIGAPRTIVISHSVWQRVFGGRDDALGQSLTLGGVPATVIGVMPRDFRFPDTGVDFWAPEQMTAEMRASRTEYFLSILGRLRKDVTAGAAAPNWTRSWSGCARPTRRPTVVCSWPRDRCSVRW